MMKKNKEQGFTLLEMVLVLVIMSSILILFTRYGTQKMMQFRRDKAALQMQQILSAGLSYYASKGTWPVTCTSSPSWTTISPNGTSLSQLQSSGYLPNKVPSPFPGNPYSISCSSTTGVFSVQLTTLTNGDATIIAGQLPLASAANKVITAQVQIPGQNLNNARSINFGNIYHNGSCVPVPTCPPNMTAQIFVVPEGVSGVNDSPTCSSSSPYTCTSVNAYPITSFIAFATSAAAATPTNGPPDCTTPTTTPGPVCYQDISGTSLTSIQDGANYWRVCLSVTTEKGTVSISTSPSNSSAQQNTKYQYWAQSLGKLYVTTRCAPDSEPTGSTLNVWGPAK